MSCGKLNHRVLIAFIVPIYKIIAGAQLRFVPYKSDWRNPISGDLSGIVHSFLVHLKELYGVYVNILPMEIGSVVAETTAFQNHSEWLYNQYANVSVTQCGSAECGRRS